MAQTSAVAATPTAAPLSSPATQAASGSAATATDEQKVCSGAPSPTRAQCLSLRYSGAKTVMSPADAQTPSGYGPSDLQGAYSLPANGGSGQTIAIVDAYDDPSAESDLAVYRQQYGLPACTTANGCLQKVDQRGGTNYPMTDAGWAGEISLDLDMVSAIAPNAHILLVETDSSDVNSLGAGVDTAVAMGAKFVSNSYGSSDDPQEATTYDAYYNHPGVAVVAASGDNNYGVSYPAASQYVTAVGGTTLTRDLNTARGWSESVWQRAPYGPGSGCSQYEPKPAFQHDTGCTNRTVADVSAVADGVAVYQTFGAHAPGWNEFGGTSVATPIIAAAYADAGTPAPGTYPNSYPYAAQGGLNDITTGSNGICSPTYLCTAGPGYDGPTGLGTPDGLGAFSSGPRGDLTGTVTDSGTGMPVGQATVSAHNFTTQTDAQGHYALQLPAGEDTVTVDAFGYTQGSAKVSIADGGSATQDIALAPIPRAAVTGDVVDGSGHGWPLYASIKVEGDPAAPVWTNPATGAYQLSLPKGQSYRLDVTSAVPGYVPIAKIITVGASGLKADIPLTVDAQAATAPGYTLHVAGQTQTFDSPDAPPQGWSVVNAAGSNHGWEFTDQEGRGNLTGGTGNYAIVDSDYYGGKQDSQLVSPTYDLTGVGAADLSFDTSYIETNGESMNVDFSIDGGATWQTVWTAPLDAANYQHVEVALPGVGGQAKVQVRFHYTGSWSYYWQVDDVLLSTRTLTPTPGGLVVGTVRDSSTGAGVVGATVADQSDPSLTTTTTATSGDAKVPGSVFALFCPDLGSQRFTATQSGYTAGSHQVQVRSDETTWASFTITPAG
jgi:hypothetical protein